MTFLYSPLHTSLAIPLRHGSQLGYKYSARIPIHPSPHPHLLLPFLRPSSHTALLFRPTPTVNITKANMHLLISSILLLATLAAAIPSPSPIIENADDCPGPCKPEYCSKSNYCGFVPSHSPSIPIRRIPNSHTQLPPHR